MTEMEKSLVTTWIHYEENNNTISMIVLSLELMLPAGSHFGTVVFTFWHGSVSNLSRSKNLSVYLAFWVHLSIQPVQASDRRPVSNEELGKDPSVRRWNKKLQMSMPKMNWTSEWSQEITQVTLQNRSSKSIARELTSANSWNELVNWMLGMTPESQSWKCFFSVLTSMIHS
jgi:hypothetical protein